MAVNEKTQNLVNALAEYFNIEPESIGGFVIGVEHNAGDDGITFSTTWICQTDWLLNGYIEEIREHVRRRKAQSSLEELIGSSSNTNNEERDDSPHS